VCFHLERQARAPPLIERALLVSLGRKAHWNHKVHAGHAVVGGGMQVSFYSANANSARYYEPINKRKSGAHRWKLHTSKRQRRRGTGEAIFGAKEVCVRCACGCVDDDLLMDDCMDEERMLHTTHRSQPSRSTLPPQTASTRVGRFAWAIKQSLSLRLLGATATAFASGDRRRRI
jgi:hypothetical protein